MILSILSICLFMTFSRIESQMIIIGLFFTSRKAIADRIIEYAKFIGRMFQQLDWHTCNMFRIDDSIIYMKWVMNFCCCRGASSVLNGWEVEIDFSFFFQVNWFTFFHLGFTKNRIIDGKKMCSRNRSENDIMEFKNVNISRCESDQLTFMMDFASTNICWSSLLHKWYFPH